MRKLLFVVLGMLLMAPAGWACRCLERRSVEAAYQGADAVMSAEMIKKEMVVGPLTSASWIKTYRAEGWGIILDSVLTTRDSMFIDFARYTLKLKHNYKGTDSAATIIVSTRVTEAACGVVFQPGITYLIYATGKAGNYSTHLCSRTGPYTQVEAAELERLQQQTQPPKPKGHKGQRRLKALKEKPGSK